MTSLQGSPQAGRTPPRFSRNVLDLDCASAAQAIEEFIRRTVGRQLHRRGTVVAVSGGVDSAVCVTLAVRALGPQRVRALLLPDRDSPPEGTARAQSLCEALSVPHQIEDITPALEALGCYGHRDEAIRHLFPDYGADCRQKIAVADDLLGSNRMSYFNLIVQWPDGRQEKSRMPLETYLQVVAATNMKQRTRKLLECYHAERLNYAVVGTPNRLEYELGFFVRGGDGLADLKPIAHLYKSQIYALAEHLGVPADIRRQPPSTDTYSLPQTQEEFYFALPYEQADLLLWALRHGVSAGEAGAAIGLTAEQVDRAYHDMEAKRRAAALLHQAAVVLVNAT